MKPTISRVVGVAISQHLAVALAVALTFAVLALGVAGALSEPRSADTGSLDRCDRVESPAGCPALAANVAGQESTPSAAATPPRGEATPGPENDSSMQEAPSPAPPSTGSGGLSSARDPLRGAGWAVIIAILGLIGAFMVAESRTERRP